MSEQAPDRELPLFAAPVAVALAAVSVLSFLAFLLLSGYAGEARLRDSPQPSAYSVSALGHKGLVESLKAAGWRVVVSRGGSADKAAEAGALLLLEPLLGSDRVRERVRQMLSDPALSETPILLVLPKRSGEPDPNKPSHLADTDLIPVADLAQMADMLALDAEAFEPMRPKDPEPLRSDELPTDVKLIQAQLVRAEAFRTWVGAEAGWLLGRRGPLWVLSDPDLLANHGIGEAGNARFVAALLTLVTDGEASLVIDESIHSPAPSKNLIRLLMEPPLLYVTLTVLAAAIALVWMAAGRFGTPDPDPPAIARGHDALIETMVRLVAAGERDAVVISRYLTGQLHEVAARLHAPAELDEAGLTRWVDRVAAARGLDQRYGQLRADLADAIRKTERRKQAMMAVAIAADRWKREMVNAT